MLYALKIVLTIAFVIACERFVIFAWNNLVVKEGILKKLEKKLDKARDKFRPILTFVFVVFASLFFVAAPGNATDIYETGYSNSTGNATYSPRDTEHIYHQLQVKLNGTCDNGTVTVYVDAGAGAQAISGTLDLSSLTVKQFTGSYETITLVPAGIYNSSLGWKVYFRSWEYGR